MKPPIPCVIVLALVSACAGVKNGGASGAAGTVFTTGAAGTGAPPAGALEGLVTLTVTPPSQTVTFQLGDSAMATYKASGKFKDGSTRDVTGMVTWTSSAPLVVTVGGGVATARGPGSIDIIATSSNVTGSAKLIANVMGSVVAAGFPAADQTALDGTATPAAADIAYPPDGALFPGNWGAVTVQIAKTNAAQASARLTLSGTGVDIRYYGACEAGPNSMTPTAGGGPAGCYVTLPSDFTRKLAAASEAGDLTLTARLAGGGAVAEGKAIKVAWTSVLLTGGIYYWTANDAVTSIYRYDFSGDATKPQAVYTDTQVQTPAVDGAKCIGCHAISHDGTKLALILGGSYPSTFQMVDVASGMRTTFQNPPIDQGYATQTTFSNDGTRMVQMFRGKLKLRTTDAVPMDLGEQLTSIKENKSDIFWSSSGKLFAFDSFDPSMLTLGGDMEKHRQNSDMKKYSQIWITDSDGKTLTDQPRLIVPRKPGYTSYYPSISDDDALVVYNQSDCATPGGNTQYGTDPCDSYDDISASLNVVSAKGGSSVTLTRANGGPLNGNSWPRWSPDHGTFRGKRLYWVAFSSRRPYGLQINTKGFRESKPQLWFAAVAASDDVGAGDPSFSAVWLPGQNVKQAEPNGNHVPVWVEKIVVIE